MKGFGRRKRRRGVRAGIATLLEVADPVNQHILRELLDGPVALGDIPAPDGSPSDIAPEDADTEAQLTEGGHEMLFVAFILDRWLTASPLGPLKVGDKDANRVLAALICGWSSTVVHTLARQPLAIDALHRVLQFDDYRIMEEQVDELEATGQLVAIEGDGATRYEVSEWGARAIAPLAASARLESRKRMALSLPVDTDDTEAAFRMTLPLLRLPADLSGSARLDAELEGRAHEHAGVVAVVEGGRVASVEGGLEGEADVWVAGPVAAWFDAAIEGKVDELEFGGDLALGGALLSALHEELYGIAVP